MEPILKWAGGKRWLAKGKLISVPRDARLIEPFVGSGAVFFAAEPNAAILSDKNDELMNLYRCIRDKLPDFLDGISALVSQTSVEAYYQIRSEMPVCDIERAVRTLYLNRLCWNGLYRVNKHGFFNVPKGTKTKVVLESDNFSAVSDLLQRAELVSCDFQETVDRAKSGDWLFVDPPYTARHNSNGFLKYNESIFSWEDQERLRDCVARAAARGALVYVTNADHQSVRDLYADIADYTPLYRKSVLAASPLARGPTTEALFVLHGL